MHKTVSIVFLLLTLIIALVLSGFSNQKRVVAKVVAVASDPAKGASDPAKAAPSRASDPAISAKAAAAAVPPTRVTGGVFSPYSGVQSGGAGSALQSAYQSSSTQPPSSESTRQFEYLLTPVH
jgi:hypothetical protein